MSTTKTTEIEKLLSFLEHAPEHPGRVTQELAGWLTREGNRLCAHCAGRILARGCAIPFGAQAVWKAGDDFACDLWEAHAATFATDAETWLAKHGSHAQQAAHLGITTDSEDDAMQEILERVGSQARRESVEVIGLAGYLRILFEEVVEAADAGQKADRAEILGDAPSQEDIHEGICLAERGSGICAHYERRVIAQAETHEEVFAQLEAQALALCSPRIFAVNERGNVTEYNYQGDVIGSWV